jgi:TetR/AcrR family transcriptional regulator
MDGAASDNRTELLDCALRLFVAHGYDGVGVQQIVAAAGVTKPTLYHYFGSKLGLLEALLDAHLGGLYAELEGAAAYHHDLSLTLAQLARSTFAFARAHPDAYRLHLSLWFAPAQSQASRAAARFHQRQFAFIEGLFRDAARDHGNMKGRHQAYAATYLGMLNTYVGLALNGYTALNDALVRQSVHQFMHGIFS